MGGGGGKNVIDCGRAMQGSSVLRCFECFEIQNMSERDNIRGEEAECE